MIHENELGLKISRLPKKKSPQEDSFSYERVCLQVSASHTAVLLLLSHVTSAYENEWLTDSHCAAEPNSCWQQIPIAVLCACRQSFLMMLVEIAVECAHTHTHGLKLLKHDQGEQCEREKRSINVWPKRKTTMKNLCYYWLASFWFSHHVITVLIW